MTFGDFWPQYLRAHRLPGTRALHYFATVVGLIFTVEAVLHRQPMLMVGVGLGYAIAIGAHRLIERNRPMIGVSAVWGVVADLRMVWLALTGGLGRELARAQALHDGDETGFLQISRYLRAFLVLTSILGLAAAVLDLDDLFEPGIGLHYALLQLGAPVVAFAGALVLAAAAIWYAPTISKPIVGATAAWGGGLSPVELSLWHACMALLMFGAVALGLAELAEHGMAGALDSLVLSTATIAIALMPALFAGRKQAQERQVTDHRTGALTLCCSGLGLIVLMGSLAALGWQAAPLLGDAKWRALSLGDLMHKSVPGPDGHWFSALPWSLPVALSGLFLGFILLGAAYVAADRSHRRHADRLFQRHLEEIRTGRRPT